MRACPLYLYLGQSFAMSAQDSAGTDTLVRQRPAALQDVADTESARGRTDGTLSWVVLSCAASLPGQHSSGSCVYATEGRNWPASRGAFDLHGATKCVYSTWRMVPGDVPGSCTSMGSFGPGSASYSR